MMLALVLFATATTLLWLSIYGYLLLLAVLAQRRRRAHPRVAEWPEVALVIPTLNEAATIAAKLADLRRTDYPADKLAVVVVDGGSTDGTVDYVNAVIAAGVPLELWQIEAGGSKARQVNYAMERLRQAIVVVTDADGLLDPSCVRDLVTALIDDPQTAIVGASIRVATDLPEERLYWRGISFLWWLEGEALSAAIVSGVCYAARRPAAVAVAHDARAEDAHLSLRAAGQGLRVRISRSAWATEVRVPHTAQELLAFRRRRGNDYLRELCRHPGASVPLGARVARRLRLFHFRRTPALAALVVVLGVLLLFSTHWRWPLIAAMAFIVPPACWLGAAPGDGSRRALTLAAMRLVGLVWVSLLSIRVPRSSAHIRSDDRSPLPAQVSDASPAGFAAIDEEATP
jgi:hypothetical protein